MGNGNVPLTSFVQFVSESAKATKDTKKFTIIQAQESGMYRVFSLTLYYKMIRNRCPDHLLWTQVTKIKPFGMQTVVTEICNRMCRSQELCESLRGTVMGCHLCNTGAQVHYLTDSESFEYGSPKCTCETIFLLKVVGERGGCTCSLTHTIQTETSVF